MFHNVRVAVMDKTKGDQVPWTEDGIQLRERVLFGGEVTAPASSQAGAMRLGAEAWKAGAMRLGEAAEALSAMKDAPTRAALEAYIIRSKDTYYAELARRWIEKLKERQGSCGSHAERSACVFDASCSWVDKAELCEKRSSVWNPGAGTISATPPTEAKQHQ